MEVPKETDEAEQVEVFFLGLKVISLTSTVSHFGGDNCVTKRKTVW